MIGGENTDRLQTAFGAKVPLSRFDDAHHTYHANSIEKVFGMARSMVTLIAKVS